MDNKIPNMISGKRGRLWTQSLTRARDAGAVIVADETGAPVEYKPSRPYGSARAFRAWVDAAGNRYDARECSPRW